MPYGGAEGSRTPALLIANQPLYQLSYDPIQSGCNLKGRPGMSKRFSKRESGLATLCRIVASLNRETTATVFAPSR